MGRFYVSDSLIGTGATVLASPRGGTAVKRPIFGPSGQVITLSAVEDFTPWTDFQPPLATMSDSFRPYFCGRKYRNHPESRIRPMSTLRVVNTGDIHDYLQQGAFRLPQTVHLFGLLRTSLSFGTVLLSRRQPNLLYMIGTNQSGHLVTVTFTNGGWVLDAKEPTDQEEWPVGTRIFFLE